LASASYPTVAHLFADGGYAGEKLENALQKIEGPAIEIVRRSDGATGFAIVARRCHDFSSLIVDSAPLSSEKAYTSPIQRPAKGRSCFAGSQRLTASKT
jgi:hypothetical protein